MKTVASDRTAADRKAIEAALTAIPNRGTAVFRGRMVTRSTNGQRYTIMGLNGGCSMWLWEAISYFA